MLSYLEETIRAGVREGRFSAAQARADLEVALWYSYACNNVDEYEYYYRAADWMSDSEQAAERPRVVLSNKYGRLPEEGGGHPQTI